MCRLFFILLYNKYFAGSLCENLLHNFVYKIFILNELILASTSSDKDNSSECKTTILSVNYLEQEGQVILDRSPELFLF